MWNRRTVTLKGAAQSDADTAGMLSAHVREGEADPTGPAVGVARKPEIKMTHIHSIKMSRHRSLDSEQHDSHHIDASHAADPWRVAGSEYGLSQADTMSEMASTLPDLELKGLSAYEAYHAEQLAGDVGSVLATHTIGEDEDEDAGVSLGDDTPAPAPSPALRQGSPFRIGQF